MIKLTILGLLFLMSCTSKVNDQIDLPVEFNIETISHDRANPTFLMAVYDTTTKKYVFEFMDN